MTVTVAFDGAVIDTADSAANWTAVKITSGGQSPTAVAADAAYEGTNNVTCRSDNKRVYMYTDIGAGNELDFTGGGNADGDLFYIWVNFLPSPLLNTQAGGGLGIFMESRTPSTSVYSLWYFHGRDTYTGGWVRLAVDPNKTPSITNGAGSFDPTSVRYFGAFAHNNQGTAKYDNFVVDQCAYGKGLIVTGTSTLGLVEELIADEETNRHGVVTALNDSGTAAELLGKLTLGDDVGTASTTITDEDSKLFAAEPLYYETTLQASCPLDFAGINIVGNGTGDTSVILGQAVGTDKGRNGISLVGNDTYNIGLDRDDGAVETADLFGCSLENMTGTLNLDGAHDFNGDTMSGCGPVTISSETKNLTSVASGAITLSGSGKLTDSLIINNTAAAAVLCDTLADVSNCDFTSDGTGYAVDLGTGITTQSMTWDSFLSNYAVTDGVTGNEAIKVAVANDNTLTINVTGGTTPTIHNASAGNGAVDVSASVSVTVTATTSDGTPVEGASVYLKTSGGTVVLDGVTNSSGVLTGSYGGATPAAIDTDVSGVKSSSSATPYEYFTLGGQIESGGYNTTALLSED